MKTVRVGVFETNSSSTHSLTICSKEEYELWMSGKLLLGWDGKFVEKNDENTGEDDDLTAYEDYENEYLEEFYEEYTTKSGEVIVVFGKYGTDN